MNLFGVGGKQMGSSRQTSKTLIAVGIIQPKVRTVWDGANSQLDKHPKLFVPLVSQSQR